MKPMCIASFLKKAGLDIYLKSVPKYKLLSDNEHSISWRRQVSEFGGGIWGATRILGGAT